jgi:hypothetical protein
MGVTLFEQLFCAKNAAKRAATSSMLRPPSSRSARVAAKRASFYNQIPPKFDLDIPVLEVTRTSGSETTDIHDRLKHVEEDISSIKNMLREVLAKL